MGFKNLYLTEFSNRINYRFWSSELEMDMVWVAVRGKKGQGTETMTSCVTILRIENPPIPWGNDTTLQGQNGNYPRIASSLSLSWVVLGQRRSRPPGSG